VALALVVSGVSAFIALGRAGLPDETGAAPSLEALRKPIAGIPAEVAVYVGTLVSVPVLAGMVWSARTVRLIPADMIASIGASGGLAEVAATFLDGIATIPGLVLTVTGIVGFAYLAWQSFTFESKVERERMWVVLVLMFFSMLFWAFFEQAGSSVSNFTDRNVDRQFEERVLTQADVGSTLTFRLAPTGDASLPLLDQEQLGYTFAGEPFTMTKLSELREKGDGTFDVEVDPSHVGMGVGGTTVPASTFQAANPIYILLFGLLFSSLWTFLGRRGIEPSTPVKFALGLLQLGLGFGLLWYGAVACDARGMVGMHWLLLGYLLHTTGELCLSPVGLSMVTKLTPKQLVSTAMGAWFLATAFSNLLAGVIAVFTGGGGHGGGESAGIPVPLETVHVYGGVFGVIGATACACALFCFLISPFLRRWMHEA
jgi:POT family proton-dependent oligopeptide transporter